MQEQVHRSTSHKKFRLVTVMSLVFTVVFMLGESVHIPMELLGGKPETLPLPRVQSANAAESNPKTWHPPHMVKVWLTNHKGRTFRVTQLPRCEHMEAVIAYNPSGETLKQAQKRMGGVAASTGSFHHPRTFALADFLQKDGAVYAGAKTGRAFFAMHADGRFMISKDYSLVKGKPDVNALALGQRLVPLERDGFSTAFMNSVTDRMAVGMNDNFIFIVQGKSDIWRLAHFMQHKLPCTTAVNSDGGHVVRGVAPVHVVFRWRTSPPPLKAEADPDKG